MNYIKACLLVFVFFYLGTGYGQNQDSIARLLAKQIDIKALEDHVYTLADDKFEGRETGTYGEKKAASYIAEQFIKMGLSSIDTEGNYTQEFKYEDNRWRRLSLSIDGFKYRNFKDFYAFPSKNKSVEKLKTKEILFLGYGIETKAYNDYKKTKVQDKVIIILSGEPRNENGISLVTESIDTSDWSRDISLKLEVAKKHGARMVLIIDKDFEKNLHDNKNELIGSRLYMCPPSVPSSIEINHMFISEVVAQDIFKQDSTLITRILEKKAQGKRVRKASFKSNIVIQMKKRDKVLNGKNILGFIEGTDSILKEEVIVLSAHYDHLGVRGKTIYNGADDNASGTAGILEIARLFNTAKQKGIGAKRSLLCLLVSGEEKGLLGSKYYAAYPTFPLAHTVANINVDMIGRIDKKHFGEPNYIYVIGSDRLSSELHFINEMVNQKFTQLELDYTYNALDDPNRYYYRSDHYSFAERGIPAIFYFNGTHDDYHKETDTVEKINFEKMVPISQLIFHTAWELANRPERIQVDKK